MVCCFTGHRYFPWSDNIDHPRYRALLVELEKAIDLALAKGATHFICGNAVGVDTWAAELVLKKKRTHPEIFLEIALPFAGHNANESVCQKVQQKADLVHIVSTAKSRKAAFLERDRYMVEHSDLLIAVYSELRARGGAAKKMEYAKKQRKEVLAISVERIRMV